MLKDRHLIHDKWYKIVEKLSKGSFGLCFKAIDLRDNNKSVICKVNEDDEMNKIEGLVLKKLNDKGYKNFPKLLAIGHKYKWPY